MPSTTANSITIEYDTFGSRGARPLLLVMGLGAQMIAWPEEFCDLLAAEDHYVIRFDNRDVGHSTKFDHAGIPDVAAMLAARERGETVPAPYLLADMAADAAGLLDALSIEAAHVVGASMGGMIVQQMAIQHPGQVLTLTSIMSTTGAPDLPGPRPEAMGALLTPAPTERDANIEHSVMTSRTIGSAPHLFDEERVRRLSARRFDRSFHPAGTMRQMVAIGASGSRREALASVRAPSLVIHGEIDPLVPVEGGRDTAAAIPGAELLVLEHMGHDLPMALWPEIVGAISRHTARVPAGAR